MKKVRSVNNLCLLALLLSPWLSGPIFLPIAASNLE